MTGDEKYEEPFEVMVQRKRMARMTKVDELSPEMRELVHEYGLTVVTTCIDIGVIKPKHIRHLVETILDEFSPSRGSFSKQGKRTEISKSDTIDT
jgi:hypothetical protein